VLASKGPVFEEQMNQFLSKYNTDPVYSTLIPPSFIEQLSDIASRSAPLPAQSIDFTT
jgi:hypothetical protein